LAILLGQVVSSGQPASQAKLLTTLARLKGASASRHDTLIDKAFAFGAVTFSRNNPNLCFTKIGFTAIVADALLCNRHELCRVLGLCESTGSDAALILMAYQRWGSACLSRLNGEFAFAIHDAQDGVTFLARDHVGTRPLYWAHVGDELLFSSFVDGITSFDGTNWTLSERRIARHLKWPSAVENETFYNDIHSVAPGHWLAFERGRIRHERWWDPAKLTPQTGVSPAEAAEVLRSLTESSIQSRIDGCSVVGTHISAGIDSTVITLLCDQTFRARGGQISAAYTWSPAISATHPDMGHHDERRLIAQICSERQLPIVWGEASAETFERLLDQPMELQGVADLVDELPVISHAAGHGLEVMLSGWGGDEVFSNHAIGYAASLLRQGRLRSALQLARVSGGGFRRPARVIRYLWRAGLIPNLPDILYRHVNPFVELYPDGAFLSAELAESSHLSDPPTPLRLLADPDVYVHNLLLQGHIGERMATWAAWSRAGNFEYRYPLVDRRLLEFILTLSPDIRFGRGAGRRLARSAFADILPKGLNKQDPANERHRQAFRMKWWRTLSDQAAEGRFDDPCEWLDMTSLRQAIVTEPPKDAEMQLKTFAQIFVALRIWSMYQRHKSN
jgi:asparagine synthase (glutamine-hydrolysing)